MLVESSICRFNHVFAVFIKTVIFFTFRLDLDTTTSTTLKFYRVQVNAFNIITIIIIIIKEKIVMMT